MIANHSRPPLEALAVVLALWLAVLHLWGLIAEHDPRLIGPHTVAFVEDLLLIGVALAIGRLLSRWCGQALAVAGLLFTGAALAAYPLLLRDYLAFPVNLFDASPPAMRQLIAEYLGVGRLWPVAAALLLGAASLFAPLNCRPSPGWKRAGCILLAVLSLLALLSPSPHPFVRSLQGEMRRLSGLEKRAVASLLPLRAPERSTDVPPMLALTAGERLSADHVFLIVMESVTAREFEKGLLEHPGGFADRVRAHATYFANHHSTNLDSYTALLAMLSGVQVPYRAYADPRGYERVNQADNLVRALRGAGYSSLFISTYAYQPFVPHRADFDRVMDRADLPALEGYLSLGRSRMEMASEDRAALDTIARFAEAHPQSLIVQEMIYGHSPQWRHRTGKSTVEYCDAYLSALLDRLESAGLAEKSLIVVISDHGERDADADPENYRVPLMVVGPGVRAARDHAFRSHLDLPAIVLGCLRNTPLPPARDQALVVGNTGRWVYGRITADGKSLFIDDMAGSIAGGKGSLDPQAVRQDFQALINAFGSRYETR